MSGTYGLLVRHEEVTDGTGLDPAFAVFTPWPAALSTGKAFWVSTVGTRARALRPVVLDVVSAATGAHVLGIVGFDDVPAGLPAAPGTDDLLATVLDQSGQWARATAADHPGLFRAPPVGRLAPSSGASSRPQVAVESALDFYAKPTPKFRLCKMWRGCD